MNSATFDLRARARRAVLEAGFEPDFPAAVLREASAKLASPPPRPGDGQPVRDMRSLLWSSIDNQESRDLDQVEYAEQLPDGGYRLLVGIADVDELVPQGSATDQHAGINTTSVYTGVATFPMLPLEYSTEATSLLNDVDRKSFVIELHVRATGEVDCHDVYPALLRNRAKLAYGTVGAWLEGNGPMPPAVGAVPGMEAQLRLQLAICQKLRDLRKQQGALTFGSIEARPVVVDGKVQDLVVASHNVAEDIIESFMVAANVAMAQHLRERGRSALRRVVRTPQRWDRICDLASKYGVKLPADPNPRALSEFLEAGRLAAPERFPDLSLSVVKLLGPGEYIVEVPGEEQVGHFGLAVQDYTHSTAPNRRFSDLVTQRLLKAAAANTPAPYATEELRAIAARCTDRENAARKVERLMRKVAASVLLQPRIGEVFDAIITGASPKGTYARLLNFPAEGRIVRSAQGLDVGDKARVKLLSVDMERGFIDFERANGKG